MLSKLDFATLKPVGNYLGIGFKGLGLTLFLVAFLYMTTQTIQELKRVIYQMVDYAFILQYYCSEELFFHTKTDSKIPK
ncbi:unnamed protein product [Rhizophagus irregularis]|nr:unnamed protein product [Rhizophagus irregularis]